MRTGKRILDLVSVDPLLNLYDKAWPIRTYQAQNPPAEFVFAQETKGGRLGIALDSIVAHGCIISGGRVQNSVLSPGVRINSYCEVRNSNLDGKRSELAGIAVSEMPSSTRMWSSLQKPRSGTTPEKTRSITMSLNRGVVVIAKGTGLSDEALAEAIARERE